MAAEYVATEETLENVGSALEAFERLQEVQRKYWDVFFADQRKTFEALTESRSWADLDRAVREHWNRRIAHSADSFGATLDVLADEARSFMSTFFEMWKPMAELVRRDVMRSPRSLG